MNMYGSVVFHLIFCITYFPLSRFDNKAISGDEWTPVHFNKGF